MLRMPFGMSLTCNWFKGNQSLRSKVYHYALEPKLLAPKETVEPTEERLYKPVAPADKWEHSGTNHDPLVSRMIGMITERGERETAREVMRLTFREIKLIQLQKFKAATEEEKKDLILNPTQIIHDAVKNCTPILVLHSVVRGGMLYKVPAPPRTDSVATHMAIKFVIDAARDKPPDTRIWASLARELIAASQNQGKAFRKKQELIKQCEENRAYATYRTY
ncbi:28S ribosomal protein S7 mitochondrial [Fasciola hepatica]|uniref:28S ribosomal protein S7 mitochondrial n=1 Tax=Fasciola hepatica TaxID=6192 RepID=A0A4E0S012_FASHE|nr:28S ribosomal protein S7 mitochondrial [Fasciola hepatica]